MKRTPTDLARTLGVNLPSAKVKRVDYVEQFSAAGLFAHCGRVDSGAHPAVRAALCLDTDDRSADTYRIVAACYDEGLTLEQTRAVVDSRADLAERLARRNDDDVLTCWVKVIDVGQQQVQISGIGTTTSTTTSSTSSTTSAATAVTGPAHDSAVVPVFADLTLTRSALRDLPEPKPLILDTLDLGTVGLLYGKWATAKSFITLDWGLSVATGRKWQGRPTTRRRVLYIAGEGAFGLKGRVTAWEVGWHTTVSDGDFAILPQAVNLTRPIEVANLAALIAWGGYDFVILDTLARCMVGADENSAKDCGLVVDAMTRLLGHTPGGRGCVLGVHHAGKDGKTLRGSSAFEGAADTVYFTSKDDSGLITLDREKRKDGPESDTHHLFVDLIDGTGSAVVSARHLSAKAADKPERAQQLLSAFVRHFEHTGATKVELRVVADMAPATFHRSLSNLLEHRDLINTGTDQRPFYQLASK